MDVSHRCVWACDLNAAINEREWVVGVRGVFACRTLCVCSPSSTTEDGWVRVYWWAAA